MDNFIVISQNIFSIQAMTISLLGALILLSTLKGPGLQPLVRQH